MNPILFAAVFAAQSAIPAPAPRGESSSIFPPPGTIQGNWSQTWRPFTFDPVVEAQFPRVKLDGGFNAEQSMPNADAYSQQSPRLRYVSLMRFYNVGPTS